MIIHHLDQHFYFHGGHKRTRKKTLQQIRFSDDLFTPTAHTNSFIHKTSNYCFATLESDICSNLCVAGEHVYRVQLKVHTS